MATVQRLLEIKGNAVWTIRPDAMVFEALRLMAERNVGALMVLENDRLVGVISERDYARSIALMDRSSRSTPVREIMTSDVIAIHPDQSLDECMALMTAHHIRHLPVLDDDNQLIGVISIGDVVKYIISEQDFLIKQLESYIAA